MFQSNYVFLRVLCSSDIFQYGSNRIGIKQLVKHPLFIRWLHMIILYDNHIWHPSWCQRGLDEDWHDNYDETNEMLKDWLSTAQSGVRCRVFIQCENQKRIKKVPSKQNIKVFRVNWGIRNDFWFVIVSVDDLGFGWKSTPKNMGRRVFIQCENHKRIKNDPGRV